MRPSGEGTFEWRKSPSLLPPRFSDVFEGEGDEILTPGGVGR